MPPSWHSETSRESSKSQASQGYSETLKEKKGWEGDLDRPGSSQAVSPAGSPRLRLFSSHTPNICLEGTLHGARPRPLLADSHTGMQETHILLSAYHAPQPEKPMA